MNYLELVQMTLLLLRAGNERLDDPPDTVVGLKGIQYEVVQWVRLAEKAIQNHRSGWLFMMRNATIDIPANQRITNLAAALGNYSAMVPKMGDSDPPFITVWENDGDAEIKVWFIKWADWSGSVYDRAPREVGDLPIRFTIQPDGRMVLDPAPAKAVKVNLNYRAKAVEMPVESDAVPVVPADYHELIVYWAIVKFYCLTRDKTQELREKANIEYVRMMTKLYNEQLPAVDAGNTDLV